MRFQTFRPLLYLPIAFIAMIGCKKVQEATPAQEVQAKMNDHNGNGIDIKLIADNLVSPVGVVAVPDDKRFDDREADDRRDRDEHHEAADKRLFIIDQAGKIWIIDANGNKMPVPFLDLTGKIVPLSPFYDERGLLGFAFHPNFKRNGKFFVFYTAPPRAGGPQPGSLWNNLSRVSEFRVSASNPNLADMTSEKPILEVNHPQSNHNGGTIAFGPDGFLYISIGDGGGADDVGPGHVEDWYPVNRGGNGQDIDSNLLGNILRLDVDHGSPYAIPHDNPFVGKRGLDEIYAYGLRNPFRFSFDMGGSHQLISMDAGQSLYEEIDLIKKGGNYGWNVKEGRHCFDAANDHEELGSCPMMDPFGNLLIDPVIEVNNAANPDGGKALTIIGGNVYRGHSIPQLEGKYIFGTFSQSFTVGNGELFMANRQGDVNWPFQEINLKSSPNDIGYFLKGFGQDREGEIYLTVSGKLGPSGTTGKVFKLVPVRKEDDDKDKD